MALLDGLEGIAALHMSINGITSRGEYLVLNNDKTWRTLEFLMTVDRVNQNRVKAFLVKNAFPQEDGLNR